MMDISKRPWEAKARDVLTRNPEHPDQEVEWTVTGRPFSDGWFTFVTYSMPEGGEGVAVCKPGQYVTLRSGATYVLEPIYTDQRRDESMQVFTCGDRAYIAGFVRQHYPEIFDQALQRITRRVVAEYDAKKETTR